jgi:hypothetical protein
MNRSTASSRDAVSEQLQSYQVALLDVLLFSQYINARSVSNETLATFYADRFRGEAKEAFQSWMATQPFQNATAPPHPFVTNFYQPHRLELARLAQTESQRLWQEAGAAGRTSRGYVLVTVVLASALFCGGIAPRFESLSMRRSALAVGLLAFAFAAQRLVSLPVQL